MSKAVTVTSSVAPLGGASSGLRLVMAFILLTILVATGCRDSSAPGETTNGARQETVPDPADFVGSTSCGQCHSEQVKLWQGSHHDLAMQDMTGESVLGDFNNAVFDHQGSRTGFSRRDDQWWVRTAGADGEIAEFPVRYTFGVYPLQQYLVELPNKKLQALSIAWDSRPENEDGQRWFHVYGDEPIDYTDVLHWTQPSQNWDTMCADCHSTGLIKRYDLEQDRFDSSWEEIDVACEACHGPGRAHLDWANSTAGREGSGSGSGNTSKGLVVVLDNRQGASWNFTDGIDTAIRSEPARASREVTSCAGCHSRRSRISTENDFGIENLDTYAPALISEPLYYADGQIRDEVYVYGSFVQSRMYQQGVTCSDCHEPHSLELRAPGSEVCAGCHRSERYATEEHTLHSADSTGASCIECHMPATTYMQVDPRHDHSLRVPRLELSAALDLPDPCTQCHTDRDVVWALEIMRKVGRATPQNESRWSEWLAVSTSASPDAGRALLALISDETAPAILRASAIMRLPVLGEQALEAIGSRYIADSEPMIRWAVARVLQGATENLRATMGPLLLEDPVRAVRQAAAVALAPVGTELISFDVQQKRSEVLDEYIETQLVNSERSESHTNTGNIYRQQGRTEAAEQSYRTALRLNPFFVPAYVNLADLYRAGDQDEKGEILLQQALNRLPEQASLHHALGLLYIRQQRMVEARTELGIAANADNAELRFVIVYALVMDAQGETKDAARYLDQARSRFGNDRTLIATLVNLYQRAGDMAAIRRLQEQVDPASSN